MPIKIRLKHDYGFLLFKHEFDKCKSQKFLKYFNYPQCEVFHHCVQLTEEISCCGFGFR